ncbi:MAG: alkaline phosphatase family protein, partial [Halobacteriaceae archaeon]
MTSSKLLVVGLDGADWSLIDNWVDDGILPTIQDIKRNSTWGEMRSSIPPVTCPAWKCYSTGKNPGKLGVYWWETLDIETKSSMIPDATDFESLEVWDHLNEAGFSTGVIGMPLTYPPKDVDGYMVAGGPGVGSSGYTH